MTLLLALDVDVELRTHATRRAAFVAAVGRCAFLLPSDAHDGKKRVVTPTERWSHGVTQLVSYCPWAMPSISTPHSAHAARHVSSEKNSVHASKRAPWRQAVSTTSHTSRPPRLIMASTRRNVGLMPMHVDRAIFHARSQKIDAPMGLFGRDLAIPLERRLGLRHKQRARDGDLNAAARLGRRGFFFARS